MSRRKQEKPKQRLQESGSDSGLDKLAFDSSCSMAREKLELSEDSPQYENNSDIECEFVEPTSHSEQDMLICGDCQSEFPLADILSFIKHKVQQCNKENCRPFDTLDSQNPERDEPISVISNRRPSISAPIASKSSFELHSPRPPNSQNAPINLSMDLEDGVARDSESSEVQRRSEAPARPKHKDAESNTTNSEPYSFICGTCKSTLNSAWSLVQHAQNSHGMKIYIETNNNNNGLLLKPAPKSDVPRHKEGEKPISSSIPLISTSSSISPTKPSPRDPPHHLMGLENLPHPPHPYMFRFPMADRQPLSQMNQVPFSRPHGPDFRMDLLPDPFHQRISMLGFPPGIEPPPPGAFHHPFERPPRPIGLGSTSVDHALDFYSQRLRRLAGTNSTSPSQSPSPACKRTPPFSAGSSMPSTPTTNSNEKSGQESPSKAVPAPPKLKACEFCGKCFRFQSNLIVHRRSHTGEKPYKCSLCPHACTQASKLKRHMKTHMNKSPFSAMSLGSSLSDGSMPSTSSTPDSHMLNNREDRDSNIDEEDDTESEMEEEEDEDEKMEDAESEMKEEPENLTKTEKKKKKKQKAASATLR